MKIIIKNLQKKTPVSSLTRRNIARAIQGIFASAQQRAKNYEINVCIFDDSKIRKLNKKFLNKDRSTDVLAFDLSSGGKSLADIAISAETAVLNSRLYRSSAAYELCLYSAHAALHLLGYNDATKSGFKKMESIALRLLSHLKIKP